MAEVILRQIETTDLKSLWIQAYGPDADREWMKWDGPYFNNPVFDWETFASGWGKDTVNDPNRKGIFYQDQLIGLVTAYWEDGSLQQWLECGIVIYPKNMWQRGIGTAAMQAWLSDLFTLYPHLQHLGFTTWSLNQGMQKLGDKLGMVKEGQIRKVRFWQGQYYDSVKYGILRDEWLGQHTQKNDNRLK